MALELLLAEQDTEDVSVSIDQADGVLPQARPVIAGGGYISADDPDLVRATFFPQTPSVAVISALEWSSLVALYDLAGLSQMRTLALALAESSEEGQRMRERLRADYDAAYRNLARRFCDINRRLMPALDKVPDATSTVANARVAAEVPKEAIWFTGNTAQNFLDLTAVNLSVHDEYHVQSSFGGNDTDTNSERGKLLTTPAASKWFNSECLIADSGFIVLLVNLVNAAQRRRATAAALYSTMVAGAGDAAAAMISALNFHRQEA